MIVPGDMDPGQIKVPPFIRHEKHVRNITPPPDETPQAGA